MGGKKIFFNAFLLSAARFFGMVFSFFVILLISHFFGPTALGQYNLAIAIAAFFIVFSDAGISTIMVRELAKKKQGHFLFSEAFGAKLLLLFLSLALSLFVIQFFAFSFESFLFFLLIIFSFVLDSFSQVFRSVFKAFQDMHLEAIVLVSQKIVFFVLSLVFFFLGFGMLGIVLALVLSNVFSFVLSAVFFFRIPNRPSFSFVPKRKRFFSFALLLPFLTIGLLYIAASKIDLFLVNFFLGDSSAVGLYSAPKSIFDALFVAGLSFGTALFPELSFLFHSNKQKLSQAVSQIIKYLFVFSVSIAIVSIIFSPTLSELFFGAQFAGAAGVFAIYSLSFVLMLFQSLFFDLLFIADRQRIVSIIFGLTIFLNVVVSFFLIPAFGINGAAFANLLSFFVSFLLSLRAFQNVVGIRISFLPRFVLFSFVALLLLFLLSFIGGLFSLALAMALAPLFLFFSCLQKKEREFLYASLHFGGLLKKD